MLSPGILQDVGLSRNSAVCTIYASTAGSTFTWLLVEIDFNNSFSVQSTLLEVVAVLLMLRSAVEPGRHVKGGCCYGLRVVDPNERNQGQGASRSVLIDPLLSGVRERMKGPNQFIRMHGYELA